MLKSSRSLSLIIYKPTGSPHGRVREGPHAPSPGSRPCTHRGAFPESQSISGSGRKLPLSASPWLVGLLPALTRAALSVVAMNMQDLWLSEHVAFR